MWTSPSECGKTCKRRHRQGQTRRAEDKRGTISVGRGDSSHFPHIYNSTKTGGAGIVCSSVMVVPHMTFMHSEYPKLVCFWKIVIFEKLVRGHPSISGVTPRRRWGDASHFLGWRLARGVTPKSDSSREASPQKRYVRQLACARHRPIVIISHIYMLVEAMYENIQM